MANERSCHKCGFSLDIYGYDECPRCSMAPPIFDKKKLKRIIVEVPIVTCVILTWVVTFIIGVLGVMLL